VKAFADLYAALDETTKTNAKIAALAAYFRTAPPADAAWALYFLSGRKPRQIVASRRLAAWATEQAGVTEWLFGESYDAVGDLAETITLLLPARETPGEGSLREWVEDRLLALRDRDEAGQRAAVLAAWEALDLRQRFVFNKLITGSFRVGVSQQLVVRALAQVSAGETTRETEAAAIALDVDEDDDAAIADAAPVHGAGIPAAVITHRLMGAWEPTPQFFTRLLAPDTQASDSSQPYPFSLAYPIEEAGGPEALGDPAAWQVEWKWDGIRAQVVRRAGQVFIWSRGEELVTDRYPEVAAAAAALPEGVVLDGELLPFDFDGARALPFAQLQRRIGRKTLTKKLQDEIPVVFLAYDLLEHDGRDARETPLETRRMQLEARVGALPADAARTLRLSQIVDAPDWAAYARLREESRARGVEGFMLKRRLSPYRVGRQRGDWWKWKINPYTVDAVLINAQRGSGKRASLYTDYTFAVWDAPPGEPRTLVPFTKAYSGLTDAEIRRVDAFIRRNTLEKFGPVRTVKPELVFELAFEGIQRSSRHKSGIAVRFPRMLRWREDKPIDEADTLETIRALLPPEA
jgi:DNA ligase-1